MFFVLKEGAAGRRAERGKGQEAGEEGEGKAREREGEGRGREIRCVASSLLRPRESRIFPKRGSFAPGVAATPSLGLEEP